MGTWREQLLAAIERGEPARLVVLFGSAASGTMRADSDLDVGWIPTDREISLSRELGFQAALTQATGREVDLVRLDRASTLCKHEVAKHGQLLRGERAEFTRFRAAAIAEFLDFEPALREASARFRRRLAAGSGGQP